MPRPARTPEAVSAIRAQILGEATRLLGEVGFAQLSMRRLASELGMTAANIYNFYAGKDELYLAVQTLGFERLAERFTQVMVAQPDPVARVEGLVRAYVAFGREEAALYDVMLGRNTPKYADYVGTELEPVARQEKRTGEAILVVCDHVLSEACAARGVALPAQPRLLALQLWCTLHGLVSLLNTRVMQEVTDDAAPLVDRVVADLHGLFIASPVPEP